MHHHYASLCNNLTITVTVTLFRPFLPSFALCTKPSETLPLDNVITTTIHRAIKCRLYCNSESGTLVRAPSWSYLIHL